MKKILLAFGLLMLCAGGARGQKAATAASENNAGVRFEEASLERLKELARESGRPIFIDVYTTWCGPCKYMAKNVFPLREMGDYFNARFINAKFDAERGEGIEIKKRYKVRNYPTFLVLDADGKEIGRTLGGVIDAKFYRGFIDRIEKIAPRP